MVTPEPRISAIYIRDPLGVDLPQPKEGRSPIQSNSQAQNAKAAQKDGLLIACSYGKLAPTVGIEPTTN
jgi:hypothetical protein